MSKQTETTAKIVSMVVFVIFIGACVIHYRGNNNVAPQNNGNDETSSVVHSTSAEQLRFQAVQINQLKEKLAALNKDKSKFNDETNSKVNASEYKKFISQQDSEISRIKEEMKTLLENQKSQQARAKDQYRVNGEKESDDTQSTVITSLNDLSVHEESQVKSSFSAKTIDVQHSDNKPKDIPYYTIPANATLTDAVLQSDLIAEVPVKNKFLQPPIKFKAVLGKKDLLTANGFKLPADLNGIVFEGYSIGMPNTSMSCAQGFITRALFTWDDGSYSVVGTNKVRETLSIDDDTLGYISTPFGNPCIQGAYISDFNQNIVKAAVIGGLAEGGKAVAKSQETIAQNGFISNTQVLSGNAAKYVLASGIGGGLDDYKNAYLDRIKSSFDVIYIPASKNNQPTPIVINITKDIPIDKKVNGRKIDYAISNQNNSAQHLLD